MSGKGIASICPLRTTVTVRALSEARQLLGWDEKEVEFEGSSLKDLLQSLMTVDGKSFYQYLMEENRLKAGYVLSINGTVVASVETPLRSGDRVMTMDMVRLFHGG